MALTASSSLSLNVGNFVTLKLTSNNYLLWCEQVLGLAESQDLLTHLTDQPQTNPARFDKATDQAIQNFTAWQKSDRLLRGWIIGTLSEESLGLIIGLDTAYAVWEALKESYAQASQEQEFTLRQQLTYLRKEESVDINNHIRKFKSICDSLAAIGHPISDREKVYNLLTSLGPQFETFTTTMLKPPRPTYTELIAHLQNHDQRRTWFANNGSPPLSVHSPHLAFYTQQQKSSQSSGARSNRPNFSSVGRGFQAQTSPAYTGQPRRPAPLGKRRMTAAKRELYQNETCQICIKKGHIAKICWWYSPSSSSNDLPQALATLTLDNTIADHDWTSDTGATNHMAGCSEKYKGYRCFDVQQRKYIISRSVVFDEQSFPYKSQAQITSTGNAGQIIDNWTSPTQADTFFETQSTEQIPHIPLPMTLPHAITPPLHNSTPATPQTPTSSQASSSQPSNPPSPITNSPPPSPIINLLLPSPLPTELTVAPVPEPDAFVQIAPSRSDQTLDSAPPQIEVPTQSDDDSTLNTRPTSPTAVSSTTVIPADVSVAAPAPRHAMATRSKSGIVKPNPRYALLTTMNPLIPKEPRTVKQALLHPRWKRAMEEELTALHKNETWTLVPRQAHMNIIGFRWVFKAKLKADGSLDRLKARLVAKGFHQVAGQDYTETFSPVIKPGTIRLVLSIALVCKWQLRQLDVKNAFLHGRITEDLYMDQPPGMSDPLFPTHVCKLQKALYGLKQAPRAWFDRLSGFLVQYGFVCSLADPSLFVFQSNRGTITLLIYVDDMLLTGSSAELIDDFVQLLCNEFAMKDLGLLHHFLGIEVTHTADGLHLNQVHYALTLLDRFGMLDSKPMTTPLELKPSVTKAAASVDATLYRSIVGALQYLTLTRPDIAFAVNFVSQFMQDPTVVHMKFLHRIKRYVKGTLTHGLYFTSHSTMQLHGFADADWAGCPVTRRSTTGYCTFWGSNLISWCAKKQHTVSQSSTEAEYRAMAHTAVELTWLTYLLKDFAIPLTNPSVLFCDNLSALYLTVNPVFHARSKHIELDYHFVRERVAQGNLVTKHVPTTQQITDIFMKPIHKSALALFHSKLHLGPRPSLRGDVSIPQLV